MVKIRFRIDGAVGFSSSISFKNITYNLKSKGTAVFTFDDGLVCVYNYVFPYMLARRIKGVVYVIPNSVGNSGFMTLSQLKILYANGWDISSHSYNHPHFNSMTEDEIYSNLIIANREVKSFITKRS